MSVKRDWFCGFHGLLIGRNFSFVKMEMEISRKGVIMSRRLWVFLICVVVGCGVGVGASDGGIVPVPKHNSASVAAGGMMPLGYALHRPMVVKTSESDSLPSWTKTSVYMDEENIYFSGGFLNGADYSLTVRCANAEALKVAVGAVSQWIRAEFASHAQGSNNAGDGGVERYVEDRIAIFTKALHLQGIKQTQLYYEEVAYQGRVETGYNVFVQLTMAKSDYVRAKAEAIGRMKIGFDKEGNIEAKKKAEIILGELKKEVM